MQRILKMDNRPEKAILVNVPLLPEKLQFQWDQGLFQAQQIALVCISELLQPLDFFVTSFLQLLENFNKYISNNWTISMQHYKKNNNKSKIMLTLWDFER